MTPPEESLLPETPPAAPAPVQTEAEKLAAAKALVEAAALAADPNSGKAWNLTDTVLGTGAKPDWFLQDKYKNVTEQAKAYPELAKRFGSFTGAPKNDKGEVAYVAPPEVGLKTDHPVAQAFTKWAADNQLNQEGYSYLLGQLHNFVASTAPKTEEIMAQLGDKAQERIAAVAAWGKANFDDAGYATLREATKGKTAAAVVSVLEQVIAKTAQLRMPKPGADVSGGPTTGGLKAIQDAHGAKMPDGKTLRVNVDPKYREEIEQRYRDFYKSQEAA